MARMGTIRLVVDVSEAMHQLWELQWFLLTGRPYRLSIRFTPRGS